MPEPEKKDPYYSYTPYFPDLDKIFHYDPPYGYNFMGTGWTNADFFPAFEEKVIEDRGDCEVVQDSAGRHVLCFKGRRTGFMPEYLDHPVKDKKSWEEKCKWRLNPKGTQRFHDFETRAKPVALHAAAQGMFMFQNMIGGYMYLRSLMGPEELLYKFHDDPDLIHDCMQTWLELSDAVVAYHQRYVTLDQLAFGEDICYKTASLISPDMMREFLFPYYQQLITNTRQRQLDPQRKLHIFIDTDGHAESAIPVYQEIGMTAMGPFEVASDCDVVEIGKKYPDLIIHGGVDKRVLAEGKQAIDEFVDRVFPAMQKRGGYLPTCDHQIPSEVTYENYLHYRKRALEFA